MIYLDTSALVKLVVLEPGTAELTGYLSGDPPVVSASVAAVELPRALERRAAAAAVTRRAERLLERLELRSLDEEVIATTRRVPALVRSLDAIHLASAISMRTLIDAFVAYDRRLLEAAQQHGFSVVSPGFE